MGHDYTHRRGLALLESAGYLDKNSIWIAACIDSGRTAAGVGQINLRGGEVCGVGQPTIGGEGNVEDCHLLKTHSTRDVRGTFRKVFSSRDVDQLAISEIFWSISAHGTIRGMHWQSGDADGFKIVWATQGLVRDVVIDLRPASTTWLRWQVVTLSGETGALFVPAGCAHGFEVLSDSATVNYAQEKPYSQQLERGIRWDSIPAAWKTRSPILSERDAAHPSLQDYLSEVGAVAP